MKRKLLNTGADLTGPVLRLTAGGIMLPHGAQKALGLFGGYGFDGTMAYFTETLQLPWILAFAVIVIEFIGALCLLAGFATRLWSALLAVLMIGIIFFAHAQHGFFMNWFGNQKGEGFEFHLLVTGICLALILNGSGKFSVDRALSK